MTYKSLALAFAVIGTQAIQVTLEEASEIDLMAQNEVDAEHAYG